MSLAELDVPKERSGCALGGDITSPQSLNRYAYALNNPETLTDPLGLDPSDCRVNASGSVTCYGPGLGDGEWGRRGELPDGDAGLC